MILPLALAVIFVILIAGINQRQMAASVGISVVLAIFFPILIMEIPSGVARYARGITGPSVTVWVFTAVLTIAVLVALVKLRLPSWFFLLAPGIAWLGIGFLFVWPRNIEVIAGIFHWSVAFGAFLAGLYVGTRLDTRGRAWIISFLAVLFVFELLLSIYQVTTGVVDEFFGRAIGTFNHPAFFGKMALLSLVFIIPLLDSSDKRLRRLAWIALAGAAATTVLTQSRANTIAIAAVLLLWAMTLPRGAAPGLRTRMIGILLLAAAFVVPILLERFLADPDGGDREDLRLAGMRIVGRFSATGTGPNRFATVGGQTERIIAETGYPIHDSWLLAVAELGLIGAILVGLPLLYTVLRSLYAAVRDADRSMRVEARSFVLVAAGVLFIGLSGWGVLQEPTLQMVYFAAGYALGRIRRERDGVESAVLGEQLKGAQQRSSIGGYGSSIRGK